MLGTLRALNKDVFIKRMKVRVVRTEDKAEHTFTWRAFRSNVYTGAALTPQSLAVAGSFLVNTAAPRQYNVFFASAAFTGQYQSLVQPLRDAWLSFLNAQNLAPNPAFAADKFTQFIQAGHTTELHTAISNGFFWRSGDYQLEFIIETDSLAKDISRQWRFSISAQDEQALRLNVITLIRELCNLPVTYNFANKEYLPA